MNQNSNPPKTPPAKAVHPSQFVGAAGIKGPAAPGGDPRNAPLRSPNGVPEDSKGYNRGSMVTGCIMSNRI